MSPTDPQLPPGTNYCRCGGCTEHFKSVHAFELHRCGSGGDRRCMAAQDMRAAGLALNHAGYWRRPHHVPWETKR